MKLADAVCGLRTIRTGTRTVVPVSPNSPTGTLFTSTRIFTSGCNGAAMPTHGPWFPPSPHVHREDALSKYLTNYEFILQFL